MREVRVLVKTGDASRSRGRRVVCGGRQLSDALAFEKVLAAVPIGQFVSGTGGRRGDGIGSEPVVRSGGPHRSAVLVMAARSFRHRSVDWAAPIEDGPSSPPSDRPHRVCAGLRSGRGSEWMPSGRRHGASGRQALVCRSRVPGRAGAGLGNPRIGGCGQALPRRTAEPTARRHRLRDGYRLRPVFTSVRARPPVRPARRSHASRLTRVEFLPGSWLIEAAPKG